MRTGTRNGKRFLLSRTQIVPADLDDVFAFFKDPRNLAEITPLWLNFQVQWASDAAVREGTCVRYRIRWLGFPMRWESRIDRYVENVCFADEMVVGPYKSWYHLHRFRPVTDGRCRSGRSGWRHTPSWCGGSWMRSSTIERGGSARSSWAPTRALAGRYAIEQELGIGGMATVDGA
jgi:hypothetical protein